MEWTCYDSESGQMELISAETQREAWHKAVKRGCIPRHTNMVRPRTGDTDLMSVDEFNAFFEENTR